MKSNVAVPKARKVKILHQTLHQDLMAPIHPLLISKLSLLLTHPRHHTLQD